MTAELTETVDVWSRLRLGQTQGGGLEIPSIARDIETGFGPVRQALGNSGEPRILLPLGEREPVPELESTTALGFEVITLRHGRRLLRFIDLTCRHPGLEGVFIEVTNEILKRIKNGETSGQASIGTIMDYRSLLTSPAERPISPQVIAGLMGELVFLDILLTASPLAWQIWRGPLMDRHDFRAANQAVEVKTSRRSSARSVKISSVEQLVPPQGGELHLFHCALEPTGGGELGFEELVNQITDKASAPQNVLELLASMGCEDPAAPEWNETRFNREGTEMYKIAGDFPRLVPGSFVTGDTPIGVSSISYALDLDNAESYRLSALDEEAVIERMIDCL